MTLKNGVGCGNFSFVITEINDILQYITVEKCYLTYINNSQYHCFSVF